MKIIHRSLGVLLLASLTLLGGVSSCRKDDPTTKTERTLRVLSSDHNFTAAGGTGTITLAEGGFTAKSEASWITLGSTDGAKVTFTVAPFTEPTTRTGLIILTQGSETQQVAISQLGAYSYVSDLESAYTIERKGGTIELTLVGDIRPSEVKIEGLPEWASFKIEDKKLLITVESTNVFQREANLTLKLSDLYTKRFRLIQSYGPLGYNAMLGDYTLTYIAAYQGEKKTADVKLIADQAKKGFILQGLAADIPVAFEEKTNTLTIKPQELAKPQGVTASLVLASYAGLFPGADGQASANLTWGAEYTYSATWDAVSIEYPAFPFVPSEAAKKKGHHGLHFFLFEGGSYKGPYSGTTGIHTILEFSLTKK